MAKGRESDMPPVDQWESFFAPARILDSLGCRDIRGDLVEFGCGYGLFTIEAAARVSGTVHALDIDPKMVAVTKQRVADAAIHNVVVERRDFVAEGCGRPDAATSFILMFNILHIENPVSLLREAHRALAAGGHLAVIHWKRDVTTPRGPPLEIRPGPDDCRAWGEQSGFRSVPSPSLSGAPWHWGMLLERS